MSITTVVPIGDYKNNRANIFDYLNQAHQYGFDIALVMDGQDERDIHELREYACRYFEHEVVLVCDARSAGMARNIGLAGVKTEWVVFWDCDDSPNFKLTSELIKKHFSDDVSAILGSFAIGSQFYESGENGRTLTDADLSIRLTTPGIWRWIFRTQSIIGMVSFPESSMGEDQIFLANFLLLNPKIEPSSLNIYSYKAHENSNSGSFRYQSQLVNSIIQIVNIIKSDKSQYSNSLATIAFNLVLSSCKYSFRRKDATYLVRVVWLSRAIIPKLLLKLIRYLAIRIQKKSKL